MTDLLLIPFTFILAACSWPRRRARSPLGRVGTPFRKASPTPWLAAGALTGGQRSDDAEH